MLALLVFMLGAFVLGFIATGGGLVTYKFWAPKQENARRQVFENTQSYVQGKIGSLSQDRLAYESSDPGPQKQALRTMILSEAAQIDNAKLPADLQSFVSSLKGGAF